MCRLLRSYKFYSEISSVTCPTKVDKCMSASNYLNFLKLELEKDLSLLFSLFRSILFPLGGGNFHLRSSDETERECSKICFF